MKVIFEIDPTENIEVFKLITDFLEGKKEPAEVVSQVKETKKKSEPEPEPKNTKPEPEPEKVTEEPKPEVKLQQTITPDEMRRAFMAKNNTENRPKLKAILDEFGSANISGLDPQHYEAAMERLEALS